MKNLKIGFGSVLAIALLFTSVGEASWTDFLTDNDAGQELEAQSFQQRGGQMRGRQQESGEQQGMKRPGGDLESVFDDAGVEMPDDWEEMSREEQKEFMEDSGIEMPEREAGQMREGGERMELPDGFEDMTDEEKKAYIEENRPEVEEGERTVNKGQQMSRQKQVRNLTRNAQKGKNFKKFTGQLKAKKTFVDEDDMENVEAVTFMQQRGIMEGYEDGTFGVKKSINRAESLKVLLESLGEDPSEVTDQEFDDVPMGAWFAGYVKKAKEKGIVKGYSDGSFKPGNTVNQVELLKMAFESFGIDLFDYEITALPEGVAEDAWFASYLQYALDNDLLDEEDVALSEGMTREMFAEVISRLIQQQEALEE